MITFDLADIEISVTVSEINQYPNNKAGVAAQIKAKVDEVIAANRQYRDTSWYFCYGQW